MSIFLCVYIMCVIYVCYVLCVMCVMCVSCFACFPFWVILGYFGVCRIFSGLFGGLAFLGVFFFFFLFPFLASSGTWDLGLGTWRLFAFLYTHSANTLHEFI